MFPSKADALSHLLVVLQLTGIVLVIHVAEEAAQGQRGSQWMLVVCCIGVVIAIWTLFHNKIGNFGIYPEPKEEATMVTSGPYEIVRHPRYLALIVMMVGAAVYNNGLSNYAGMVLVVVSVVLKAIKEERILTDHFEGYAEYRQRTKMIIPRLL